jgi:hypothetical protein
LPHTLTEEQFARHSAITRERRAFRHRANIELAVTILEQTTPLRDAQRQELLTLLTKQTKPPRKSGQNDYYVVMVQLGRLPQEKLKALFDAAQWRIVNQQLAQFKGLEAFLKQSGQLPDEDNEADRADERPMAPKK